MKLLFTSFLLAAFLGNDKGGLITSKDKISLSITKNTTRKQLDVYQQELLKRNINLEVERIEFNKDNTIKYIRISVDCNDGFKGASGDTFTKKVTTIGFYRIYNSPDNSPFGMNPQPTH